MYSKIILLFLLFPILLQAQVQNKKQYFFDAPIILLESKATKQFDSANYNAAIPVYFNALFLSELEKNDATTSVLAHHLATCYSYIGDLTSANFFASKSLLILKKSAIKNQKLESEIYNLLGSITTHPTKYHQAKQYFQRALDIQKTVHDQREIGNIYLNFGCLEMENQHFERAEELFQKAKSNFEQINDKRGVAMSFLNLAILLVNRSEFENVNWKNGIELSNASQRELNELDAQDIQVRIFELKALFFKQLNQLDSSLVYSEKFHALKDELYNLSQMRELHNLKSTYQLQKKQLEIQRLTMEKKRAEQHATNWKIGVSFAFVLLLFAYLIFRNRRMVQLLNQQRKEQEQELRFLQAQMNPHFLFNALTTAQAMVVKGDKIEAADFLGDFSKLVRMALDLNHKERILLSDEIQFLKTLIQMEERRNSLTLTCEWKGNFEEVEDEVFLPPMLLQPFIENALFHGLPYVEDPFLSIELEHKGNLLYVEISNNHSPKRAVSHHRKSHGIAITRKRIELLNAHDVKSKYKVEILKEGTMFTVKLILPLYFTPQ